MPETTEARGPRLLPTMGVVRWVSAAPSEAATTRAMDGGEHLWVVQCAAAVGAVLVHPSELGAAEAVHGSGLRLGGEGEDRSDFHTRKIVDVRGDSAGGLHGSSAVSVWMLARGVGEFRNSSSVPRSTVSDLTATARSCMLTSAVPASDGTMSVATNNGLSRRRSREGGVSWMGTWR